MALIHFVFSSPGTFYQLLHRALGIQYGQAACFFFTLLSLTHGYQIIRVITDCCRNFSRKNAPQTESIVIQEPSDIAVYQPKWRILVNKVVLVLKFPRTAFEYLLADYGLFGRKGKYFELFLLIVEVYELPSQSYQMSRLSQLAPDWIMPFIGTLSISASCLALIAFHFFIRMNEHRRVVTTLVIDIMCDIFVGAIIPVMALLRNYIFSGFLLGKNPEDDNSAFIFGFVSTTRAIVVTSFADLLFSLAPMLWIHLMLHQCYCIVRDQFHSVQVVLIRRKSLSLNQEAILKQLQHRHGKRLNNAALFIVSVWAIFLPIIAYLGISQTSCNTEFSQHTCQLEVYPWFASSGRCSCVKSMFNCDALHQLQGWDDSQMYNYLENDFVPEFSNGALLVLEIRHCPFTDLPKSLENAESLIGISYYNGKLIDVSMDPNQLSRLMFINFANHPLKQIPPKIQKATGLSMVYFEQMPFNNFSASFADMDSNVLYLKCTSCNITSFPISTLRHQELAKLVLIDNKIESIPAEIGSLRKLQQVFLDANHLTKVPTELMSLPRLKHLGLQGNYIAQSLNSSSQVNLFLSFNPICKKNSTKIECQLPCDRKCPTVVANVRVFCHLICNTSSCAYHNRQCLN